MQVKRVPVRAKLQMERARARFAGVDIAFRTFKRFSLDDGSSHAAALTYYAFFSIFPLLLFGAAIIGYLTFGNDELRKQILDSAINGIPLMRDALGAESLARIEANRRTIALTGLGLALYAGSGAIVALEHALNKIHRVQVEPGFVAKRLRSIKWLTILGVAALGSMALGGVAGFVPNFFTAAAAVLGGFAINVFIFATAFKFLPNTVVTWREVLPGAVFTGLVFEALKFIGTFFLSQGESARTASFGTLAGAATLLIASYLLSQVVLLAAELNAVICERRVVRGTATG
ncbi:MAG TPA: YihY/virulence factor BrkB family protein [Actinomycetota bacterium]|nr:YihY/virulence factor BrkB family protein [Actinomycetota bacterium]